MVIAGITLTGWVEAIAEAQGPWTASPPTPVGRRLAPGEPLPIPTPKPIPVDTSWMEERPSVAPSRRPYQSVRPATYAEGESEPENPPPPDRPPVPGEKPPVPGEKPPPATGNPTPENPPPNTPPQPEGTPPGFRPGEINPNGPPMFGGMGNGMGNGFGQGFDTGLTPFNEPKQSKLEFPIGERIVLRDFEQIGMVQRVIPNRSDFLNILGANKLDGRMANPVEEIRVAGEKLGEVDLIVIGERGIKRYKLLIRPSVTLIQGLIARQFPLSNVQVTAAGDHVLILQGEVETPHEAEAIVSLVQEFVGSKGRVLNSIKLAGVMQVQLEVVIARVDRSGLRRLGINFQYAGQNGFAGNQVGGLSPVTNLAAASSNNAAAAGGNAFQNIGGAATNLIAPASTVFLGVTSELQQFMMQIEALQQQGVAKVLARPTLVSLNGRPAEFLVGGEQPFPYQANVNTSPSVDFKKFGTRLNFVPVVLGPDKIRLDLVPEVSSVNFTQAINVAGNQIPQFITQRIHTTVEMEPGQSLVLGGLLQTEYDAQVQKVPLLGDIPYAGAAFRRVRHEERETELIVIVTPRLVHPFDQQAEPLPLPGEESRRPTDRELYFLGLPEAPHNGRDMKKRSDWEEFGPGTVIESVPSTSPVSPQPARTPELVPPMPAPDPVPPAVGSTGRATLQPVHAPQQPSRAESSWFRWRAKANPPATPSIRHVPNGVVTPRK